METLIIIIIAVVKALIVVNIMLVGAAVNVYMERRVAGFTQMRYGPNRVGPMGLFQPFADVMKLIMKEDLVPDAAEKGFHAFAPWIALFASLAVWAVVPFGEGIIIAGKTYQIGLAPEVNIGLLYILAITSIGVFGITIAGWSSNNKYSLLGGIRASAQMISYELAMGLSILGVVLVTGTFNLNEIVVFQNEAWNGWRLLIFLQPLGFIIFFVSGFAETNRAPFDFPESEQELVAGFTTEYSGMRFGMFFLAEYVNMTLSAAFLALLYLGGWALPISTETLGLEVGGIGIALLQFAWMLFKMLSILFFMILVRWTLPRFRYDQLMHLGWKVLLPLALLNIFVTAIVVFFI